MIHLNTASRCVYAAADATDDEEVRDSDVDEDKLGGRRHRTKAARWSSSQFARSRRGRLTPSARPDD